jgi:uncharacterized protein (UPF0332 family)
MNWREFLDTAGRLAQGGSEGDWRSAISRAYYALFHHFRELLLAHGVDVGRGGQSHFNLYAGLFNCGFPSVAAIAQRIDDLRKDRARADYELGRTIDQIAGQDGVREAGAIIADFQALLATAPAAQIAAGTRAYLQRIGHLPRTP